MPKFSPKLGPVYRIRPEELPVEFVHQEIDQFSRYLVWMSLRKTTPRGKRSGLALWTHSRQSQVGFEWLYFLGLFVLRSDPLAGWLVGWVAGLLVGWLAGWLVSCLLACLVGWLAGWPPLALIWELGGFRLA